ncbi:hypothetical protein BN1723_011512 [Verticillium longisporum]|uniref:Uncharacterized protein n=1 Tax=Verticillium longisporum TaxID=100787 RepID=A0A0G4L7W6_VERLO|nr:hypothetical protein HYQ44_017155 [Verticillium longisporum]CRK18122.1 hypothetical protein BN1723_011512 [Verticillium longisporum]CRK21346.1 hypothetical protein BN1708_013090 [Verticillium longisporum]
MSTPISRHVSAIEQDLSHRTKRIKLFLSANQDQEALLANPRHIAHLYQLTNSELLTLRGIVVQCAGLLGVTGMPAPDVVDFLLGLTFDNGWTSNKPVEERPLFLEIRDITTIGTLTKEILAYALQQGYFLPIGKTHDGRDVYGHASLVGGDDSPDGTHVQFNYATIMNGSYDKTALGDLAAPRDEDVAITDLIRCHDQFVMDQVLYHNIQAAKFIAQHLIKQFASGKMLGLEMTGRIAQFERMESPRIKNHLLANLFPPVIARKLGAAKSRLGCDIYGVNGLKGFKNNFFVIAKGWEKPRNEMHR